VAIAMLAFAPFLLLFAYGMTLASAMYPLFITFAVVGASGICRLVGQTFNLRIPRPLAKWSAFDVWWAESLKRRWFQLAATAFATFCFVLHAQSVLLLPSGWRFPPANPPLAQLLAEQLRFRSGDDFRGRYLDMSITRPIEAGVFPQGTPLAAAMMKTAYDHVIEFGNDLTIQHPRFDDIPVAMEGNRMSTPMSALFHNFLLINPGETERIDYRTITRFVPHLFQLLGVRYVLSQKTLKDETVSKVDIPQLPAGTWLYEVVDVNTGQFSPTSFALVTNWQSALERMGARVFRVHSP
jgi:hypothetical protein